MSQPLLYPALALALAVASCAELTEASEPESSSLLKMRGREGVKNICIKGGGGVCVCVYTGNKKKKK